MVTCLTAARFTMNAEVLRWEGIDTGDSDDVTQGHWDTYQDPISGEILNTWVPGQATDDPSTPENEFSDPYTIDCLARGIVDGGIRVSGSTERFGDTYENIEFVKLWTPSRINLTKRDRITNIRDRRNGTVVWTEPDGSPVKFNVNGVTPLFDAFNRHIESFVLLERAEF
jgi:hypothetical protein